MAFSPAVLPPEWLPRPWHLMSPAGNGLRDEALPQGGAPGGGPQCDCLIGNECEINSEKSCECASSNGVPSGCVVRGKNAPKEPCNPGAAECPWALGQE
jgi:hypothetical protein